MKARRTITLLEAMDDSNLFAPWFKNPSTWAAWRVFIGALFGLPLSPAQLTLYQECTGRTEPPSTPAQEAWLICGRRAGKSFVLALTAVFLAAFHDYRPYLTPGERGSVLVIARDRKQARTILRYIKALLTRIPMLARMIRREASDGFDLSNQVTIEIGTASFKSTRGLTIVAALCDELAFWPQDDAAEPDYEILNALRPGMSTIPNAMLLCASSPYSRKGALWDAHRRHFGQDRDPVLVWQASTRTMNPTVRQSVIDDAMERDPANALAEYGAQFRSDIESFITREAVEACIPPGIRERPPIAGQLYSAFVDPSGGSADSFTMAIGHKEDDGHILDAIRERKPPFSPEDVVTEFATLLKSYGITTVVGDRYAGEWPREQFSKRGITYQPAAKPKSDLYRDLLPLLNSRRADLLDIDRLLTQLTTLERRTARGGRDSIDHAPGQHDDLANAVAGALVNLSAQYGDYDVSMSWVGEANDVDAFRTGRLHQYMHGWR